jgi:NADH-quinone oxidoreductase subunit M
MIPVLLILIPIVAGFLTFFIKDEKSARVCALVASVLTLVVSLLGLTVMNSAEYLQHHSGWLSSVGSSFSVRLDGMGQVLCLLTSIAYPIIFIATWNSHYKKANNFFALMLLTQAGMLGVFVAMDALLFYFFWELSLIPMYFLCSQWGGEKRIATTFKFFVYTFAGSLLMLVGILYLYSQTANHSFAIQDFYDLKLSNSVQTWLFWLMFIAFAVKMPVFPFHTWQPDTYEQTNGATTMVLSGIMVKMGVFGVIRWLLPVLPAASYSWGDTVSTMAIIGMLYASLIAIKQDDLKRLVAYSSIAHVGLMCVAIFAETQSSMQGVMIQMFNHGINIIGLWIVVELIERQFGTRRISELGGLAQKAPAMAILFVIIVLANIALPLTNGFVGEFLMFNGILGSTITDYNVVFTFAAGITIILVAIYSLNMIRNVFYGNTNELTIAAHDIRPNEKFILVVIVLLIFVIGFFPQPLLNMTYETVTGILKEADITPYLIGK